MKRGHRLLVGLMLLASAVAISAQEQAYELYRDSGLQHELSEVAPTLQQQLQTARESGQLFGDLSDDDFRQIARLVPAAFSERLIREDVVDAVRAGLGESEIAAALSWLRSDVGRKITELENESTTAQDESSTGGAFTSAAPKRKRLLERLDEGARVTAAAVEMALGMQLGMYAGALGTVPMDPKTFQSQLESIAGQLEGARPQVAQSARPAIRDRMAITYAEASHEELLAYVEFVESEAGQRYVQVVSQALENALIEAASRYGALIAESFGNRAQQM